MQVSRWIDNGTTKYSARLYHKFGNTQANDYARVGSVELDVAETMVE